uniref:Uncharacterized protein n=1 Tax=Grammatophora oceanica TaxID=210454 RepID=A0A7S1YJN7_9STRA|mmetsp:Transcript_50298/g.75132  ORF Transcript_50298/g.75132 Transcript_50298/m.75132 type:complete len:133 (+) Transcript_50298:418-816(+)
MPTPPTVHESDDLTAVTFVRKGIPDKVADYILNSTEAKEKTLVDLLRDAQGNAGDDHDSFFAVDFDTSSGITTTTSLKTHEGQVFISLTALRKHSVDDFRKAYNLPDNNIELEVHFQKKKASATKPAIARVF